MRWAFPPQPLTGNGTTRKPGSSAPWPKTVSRPSGPSRRKLKPLWRWSLFVVAVVSLCRGGGLSLSWRWSPDPATVRDRRSPLLHTLGDLRSEPLARSGDRATTLGLVENRCGDAFRCGGGLLTPPRSATEGLRSCTRIGDLRSEPLARSGDRATTRGCRGQKRLADRVGRLVENS